MVKRLLVIVVTTAMVLAMSAFTATAGEITGQGETPMVVETTPDGHQILHGKSACAFSGLNDEYLAEQPEDGVASDGFGRTQNWGQISKADRDFLTSIGVSPGNACNPTRSAGEPDL